MTARYGFAAHPDALQDLRRLPDRVRDLALLQLQHLVHGHERGAPLRGTLTGCHKVYVDPAAQWRLVVRYRTAPKAARYDREIYLLAAGARQDGAAYRAAVQRLQRPAPPTAHDDAAPQSARAHAARARSPHTTRTTTPPAPIQKSRGTAPAEPDTNSRRPRT